MVMGLRGNLTIVVVAALASVTVASAQTARQTVTFQVTAINQITVTGTPSLVINTASSGSAPMSVTSSGNSWSFTTNQSGASITASVSAVMPTGLTLSVNLVAPPGSSSSGLTPLGATAVTVVSGITMQSAAGLALSYQLDATAAASVVAATTRVVTFTIAGGV